MYRRSCAGVLRVSSGETSGRCGKNCRCRESGRDARGTVGPRRVEGKLNNSRGGRIAAQQSCAEPLCARKSPQKGGDVIILLLALVIGPMTTHPVRDGAPFMLVVKTASRGGGGEETQKGLELSDRVGRRPLVAIIYSARLD